MLKCSFDIERRWNLSVIAGVDEAGRGCLAGPVVAAAVIFPERLREPKVWQEMEWLVAVRDSKALKHEKRCDLFESICNEALAFGIGRVEAEEIDRINILQATFKAARLALAEIQKKVLPELVLMDGNHPISQLTLRQQPVVSGDKLSKTIAAASILAKVTRDRWMMEQDAQYPGYGFSIHKGYGTLTHRQAIELHGPCELHRKSFLKMKDRLDFGKRGESEALAFLNSNDFRIVKQNWRSRIGEIDIVAAKEDGLHFVEVRSRSHFSELAQVFPEEKQNKLSRLAEAFVAVHPEFHDSRVHVDLLLVDKDRVEPFWNILDI